MISDVGMQNPHFFCCGLCWQLMGQATGPSYPIRVIVLFCKWIIPFNLRHEAIPHSPGLIGLFLNERFRFSENRE